MNDLAGTKRVSSRESSGLSAEDDYFADLGRNTASPRRFTAAKGGNAPRSHSADELDLHNVKRTKSF